MAEKIGRDGKVPKRGYGVAAPIHPHMHERQVAGFLKGGIGGPYAGAPDASSSNPLDKEPPPKNLSPVPVSPGMRSRISPDRSHAELGKQMLDDAFAVSAPDDRWAHGRDPDTGRKL